MSNFFDCLHTKPEPLSYVKPNLDIFLCPTEFLSWLKKAGVDCEGEYPEAVNSNCEYSCLWICGKLKEKSLKGDMKVCYGKFGFWEHYWISYTYEGREYFLDLTLAQFRKDAPRFAVTFAENSQGITTYNDIYYTPVPEFFGRLSRDWDLIESGESKKAQDYFTHGMSNNVRELQSKLWDLE